MLRVAQAHQKKPGADQGNQADRDLQSDENLTQLEAASSIQFAPGALLQFRNQVRTRRLQCRRQPKDQACSQGHQHGEQKHVAIQGQVQAGLLQLRGAEFPHQIASQKGKAKTECASGRGQHHGFRQQLGDDPPPRRPNRHADGYLTLSSRGPGQQQVGNIETRNQQHNSYDCHHHRARKLKGSSLVGANAGLQQGNHGEAAALVGQRERAFQVRADGLQLCARLCRIRSILQSGHNIESKKTPLIEERFDQSGNYLVMH